MKKKLNNQFRIGLLMLLTMLELVFDQQSSQAAFSTDLGVTATLTVSFDVVGMVYIVPFISTPDGTTITQPGVLLTDTTGYTFPTFEIVEPLTGGYVAGGYVVAQANSIVKINTQKTSFTSPAFNFVLRPYDPNTLAISPNAGDTVLLSVPIPYALHTVTPHKEE